MRARRRRLSIATAVAAAVAGVGLTAPSATSAPPLQYVSLGDSYTAGNGAGTYTETTCWRSPDTYGALVAEHDGAEHVNAACSGGRVADLTQPRQLGAPTTRTATYRVAGNAQVQQDKWLRRAKAEQLCGGTTQPDLSWEMSFVGETTAATSGSVELTATVSCQLTAAPQIDAVTQDTDAVFLTIGGNDVNFSGIVLQCMVLRSATGCESTIAAADAALPDLRDRTAAALQAIHDRSRGNAEVHLVGYPNLLNTASYSIPEAAPTYDAGAALFAMQARGDELQAKGVAELDAADTGPHGYTFVDVKPAWDGLTHGLDPRTTPDNSQAWLVPVLAPGSQLPEWVHPTQQGYAATAEAIIDVMR